MAEAYPDFSFSQFRLFESGSVGYKVFSVNLVSCQQGQSCAHRLLIQGMDIVEFAAVCKNGQTRMGNGLGHLFLLVSHHGPMPAVNSMNPVVLGCIHGKLYKKEGKGQVSPGLPPLHNEGDHHPVVIRILCFVLFSLIIEKSPDTEGADPLCHGPVNSGWTERGSAAGRLGPWAEPTLLVEDFPGYRGLLSSSFFHSGIPGFPLTPVLFHLGFILLIRLVTHKSVVVFDILTPCSRLHEALFAHPATDGCPAPGAADDPNGHAP